MTLLDMQPRPAAPPEALDEPTQAGRQTEPDAYPARKVLLGSIGRVWLWFLVGCVAVTLLPVVIGWSSYLIESGSMGPSIKPGDVVITSPDPELADLGGRVITFDSPSVPGQIVTHRVVEIDDSGVVRTKGDANVQPDSATITIEDVRGMGRLLVRYVGLPKLWAQNGDFVPLGAFLLSLVIAGIAVRYDREDDDDPDPIEDYTGSDGGASNGLATTHSDAPGMNEPLPASGGGGGTSMSAAGAAVVPRGVADLRALLSGDAPLPVARPRAPRFSSAVVFVLLAALYGAALAVPSAMAAVSGTTRANASSWNVPQYSYSGTLQALAPWVYYRMDDTTGSNAVDSSGNGRTGGYSGTVTKGVAGALETDTPDLAATFGNNACLTMPNGSKLTPAPTVYSMTGWFRVNNGSSTGGKLYGFESARTGVSDSGNGGQYDRHVYLDGSGRMRFGVWLGYSFTLKSQAGLNDGNWHFVATTMGAAGMKLYIDGVLVDQSTNTASEVFSNGGWWRFGCGNLSGWNTASGAGEAWTGPNAPTAQQNYTLQGSLDELAIWQNDVLTATEIAELYFTR